MTDNRTTEQTATERLRALLDERGVEYYKHEDGEPLRELHEGRDDATSWRVGGANVCAVPFDDYTFDLWIDHATPEHAIAATLGRGKCRPIEQHLDSYSDLTVTVCSNCLVAIDDLEDCYYCPNCGCEVER